MKHVRRRFSASAPTVMCMLLSSVGIMLQAIDALSDVPGKSVCAKLSSVSGPSSLIKSSSLADLRGGQSSSNDPYQKNAHYTHPDIDQDNSYEDGFANYNPIPTFGASGGIASDPEHLFQESVQERVDRWKLDQMEQYGRLSEAEEANPRDAQGRLKLLQNVGKGGRSVIFFMIMLRDMYLLDVADTSLKGAFRMVARTFVAILFVMNMAGSVASITSPGHSAKKRLKAILNLDKLVEAGLLGWSFVRLTVFPARLVQREVYVAGIMHSLFFILQMQAFTRLTWDDGLAPVASQKPTDTSSRWEGERWGEDPTLGQKVDSYRDHPNMLDKASHSGESYYVPASSTRDSYY